MIPIPSFLDHLAGHAHALPALASGLAAILGGLGAGRLATPVLDAPPPHSRRPRPGDGLLLAGHARLGREIRLSPVRLRAGLAVTGPAGARRDVLRGLVLQASARGLGFCVVSGGAADGLAEAARAEGVCDPSLLSVVDGEARGPEGTHALSPFDGLPADAIARVVAAACPALSGSGPDAVRARALLDAVCGALVALRDEGFVDLRPATLLDHLILSRVSNLADPDCYPGLPEPRRLAVRGYLDRLPGYQAEKRYKQAQPVLDRHAEVSALVEAGLRDACAERLAHCLGRPPEIVPADLCAPGRAAVIRAAHGPGEGAGLAFLVSCLAEALRRLPAGDGTGMPFLVFVDGLGDLPANVAEAVLGLRRADICLVTGTRGLRDETGPAARAVAESGLRLALAPEGRATLLSGSRTLRLRPLPAMPSRTVPLERRLPVQAASVEEIAHVLRLPEILGRLLDPDLPGELATREAESRATVAARAAGGDEIAGAAAMLAAFPRDGLAGSGAAVADIAMRGGLAVRQRTATSPPPPAEPLPDDPTEEDLDLDFACFDPLASLDLGPPEREHPPRPAPSSSEAHEATAVVVPKSALSDPFLKEKGLKALAGVPLPLAPPPDMPEARRTLVGEFPHLEVLVDRILAEVEGRPAVRLRPHLFHGKPGCGKTRFARRLGEVLGVGAVPFNCGGANDSGFGGTSRQWASGRPSVPLQTIQRFRMANPGILLDEVEKVSEGRLNGHLIDALLNLTERETACRSFDLYLETEVDLSHVVWFATANTLRGLDPAFLSRFALVEVPLPGVEHADVLVRATVRAVNADRGDTGPWAFDPSEAEVEMMAEVWGGGSLRRLRAVVEKTVERLAAIDPRHLH